MGISRSGAALLLLWPSAALGQATTQLPQRDVEALSEPAIGDEFRVTASTGAIYSNGDYGSPDTTEIVVVPLSLRVRSGPLRVSATLPYLHIDSPGNIVGGGDGPPIIIDPNAPTGRTVRDGLGDLSLAAAFTLPSSFLGAVDVDVSGRVKIPTSSKHKALGTGETDFAVATEFSYPIETWAPYVSIGYRFFGDPPGIDIRDGMTASIGTTKQLGRIVAIVSYDYSRATTAAVEDAHELFAALSGPFSETFSWTGYGTVGLSTGSADFGLGVLLTARLN